MDVNCLRQAVRPYLSEKRYAHTLGCEDMAARLAAAYGADEGLCRSAALLHDITKNLDCSEQLKLCRKYGIMIKYSDEDFETLIHADTGAAVAREVFGAGDELCAAIACHTTGKRGMTALDKILFLADACEESRNYPGVEEIRRAALTKSLDEGMILSLEGTIRDVCSKGRQPYCESAQALQELKLFCKGAGKI